MLLVETRLGDQTLRAVGSISERLWLVPGGWHVV
jgi:hypothetical protein